MRARTRKPTKAGGQQPANTVVASQNTFFTRDAPSIVAVCVSKDAKGTQETLRLSVAEGADIVELNTAQLSDLEIAQLDLPRDLPYYVVCRRRRFMRVYGLQTATLPKRDDAVRMKICLELVRRGANALDMECDTFSYGQNQIPKSLPRDLLEFSVTPGVVEAQQDVIRQCREAGAAVILSCHTGRSLDTKQTITLARLMADRGADLVKIVTKHSDPGEVPRLVEVIAETHRAVPVPLMLISMGPRSALLRVVGGYVGNAGVFCRAEGASASFPEHPSLSTLQTIWRLLPY